MANYKNIKTGNIISNYNYQKLPYSEKKNYKETFQSTTDDNDSSLFNSLGTISTVGLISDLLSDNSSFSSSSSDNNFDFGGGDFGGGGASGDF